MINANHIQQLDSMADLVEGSNSGVEGLNELRTIHETLKGHDVDPACYRFDFTLARGLDYYTGPIFETIVTEPKIGSITGGGRYDNLVQAVGGDPLPGVGFAMGDVMIRLILEKYNSLPDFKPSPADILVTVFSSDLLAQSTKIATSLRDAGFKVSCFTEDAKLPKQLKYADKMGIRFVVIIGPDEYASGQATVKDLSQRQQATVPLEEIMTPFRQWLA